MLIGLGVGAVSPGTVVNGRYTVNQVLGRGANAVTYAATDNTDGKQVGSWKAVGQQQQFVTRSSTAGSAGPSSSSSSSISRKRPVVIVATAATDQQATSKQSVVASAEQ